MAQDGRNVGGDEHLIVARADHHAAGVAEPRGNQQIRLALGHHDDGAGPLQLGDGVTNRGRQIAVASIVIVAMDQMHDHLGVGVAAKFIALLLERLPQFKEVLDDAVLHHNQFTVCAAVGMGVALTGRAMGRPARMAHADVAQQRVCGQTIGKVDEFAGLAAYLNGAIVIDHGQAGRVIASIFELSQTVEDDGFSRTIANISYDSTHGIVAPLRKRMYAMKSQGLVD